MGQNRGKQFETVFKKSCEKCPGVSIDRFPDPSAGYAGIRNVCDFVVYCYPYQFYFELKSFYGNTLNFSNITDNQWTGLLEKSKIPGVTAGIIAWFIDHDITVFVPIDELQMLNDKGRKSLNIKDIKECEVNYIEIPGKKRRVLFDYLITKSQLLWMGGCFSGTQYQG